jgi:lipoyl(octanoyl) transferase
VLNLHLFGRVPLDDLHNLQRRLAYEASSRDDGRIIALVCEHEPILTIGRAGSRADIQLDHDELSRRQLEVQYIARGGGTVLHGPGQLALYVITPIQRLRWSVGDYLRRLQGSIAGTLEQLLVRPEQRGGQFALWGRSGLLAVFGVSVRHGITQHGVFLNVNPELRLYRRVNSMPGASMGSLLSERPAAGRMASVRSTLAASLAATMGCIDSHVFTGHPLLPDASLDRESLAA